MMIGTLLIACLTASAYAASSGPDCVKERFAMVTNLTIPLYIKQVNKILNCDLPKFYADCYEQSGIKAPRDLDSVIKMTCDPPDFVSAAKLDACLTHSKEFPTLVSKPLTYLVNILRSEEKGFLCAEYKRLGADVVSKITPMVDQSIKSISQSLNSVAAPDMKACAMLMPTTTLGAIDLICNRLAAGTEETKCLEKLGYTGSSLRSIGSIGAIFFALLFNVFAVSKLLVK